MGVMINGVYVAQDPAPDTQADGEFRRTVAPLRDWIAKDTDIPPEAGRYHLFAAWNCPWAHRALLARAVLGLEDAISVSYAKPRRTEDGWVFDSEGPFCDPELGVAALHEVYARHPNLYTGRITVPVLWDRKIKRIISNESADILRMLGTEFDAAARLFPTPLRDKIEAWNAFIYPNINNGVYRAGFARTQTAYDAAVTQVFDALDRIETHLTSKTTLAGEHVTEADLRLFATLARFDVAYHYAFKCNIRRLQDYPYLWRYARAIFAMPGVSDTVHFDIYKQGYFSPSEVRNPLGIIPKGPITDWAPDPEFPLVLGPETLR